MPRGLDCLYALPQVRIHALLLLKGHLSRNLLNSYWLNNTNCALTHYTYAPVQPLGRSDAASDQVGRVPTTPDPDTSAKVKGRQPTQKTTHPNKSSLRKLFPPVSAYFKGERGDNLYKLSRNCLRKLRFYSGGCFFRVGLPFMKKYRHTNGRHIVIQICGVYTTFCQEEGILLQKYRDRNGRCIAILFQVSGQVSIGLSWLWARVWSLSSWDFETQRPSVLLSKPSLEVGCVQPACLQQEAVDTAPVDPLITWFSSAASLMGSGPSLRGLLTRLFRPTCPLQTVSCWRFRLLVSVCFGHPQTCVYPDVCSGIGNVSGKLPLPGQGKCLPSRPTDSLGQRGRGRGIHQIPCPRMEALPDTMSIRKHTSG